MHTNIQIVWKDTKQIKSSFHFYHCHTQPKHLFLTIYVCISSDGCPVTQSACLTLYDPIVCSPPTSSVHGILQARTLEWVSIPFSRRSSQLRAQTRVSYVSCTGRQDCLPLPLPPGTPWAQGLMFNSAPLSPMLS